MKTAVVETTLGSIAGFRHQMGADVFLGIPYAAPPVGNLRFRAPQPAEPWPGLRSCVGFGTSPAQSTSNAFAEAIPGTPADPVGEDCLTLNVWTPSLTGRLPVMVWVYGGAFITGATRNQTYDGAALAARHGVVVVSVNYRVGAFGFLCPPGGDANCGLRDQLAAIEWVRDNAAAFGGDPANITVFGESAGAGSLLHLLTSPYAGGLARRAILQSPGVDHTQLPPQAEQVLREVMAVAEVDEARELWQLPAESLLAAQEAAFPRLMGRIGAMPFHPFVDGDFLTGRPGVNFGAPEVDLLVSWTAEEMRLFRNPSIADGERLAGEVRTLITRQTGIEPDQHRIRELLDFYRGAGSPADAWAAIQTDCIMRLPARRVAAAHARTSTGGHTYTAQFDWGAGGGKGAFHAIDLPFTFGTLDCCGWPEFLGISPGDDRGAHTVAEHHMAAWADFARTGDPGWPPYPDQVLRLDAESRVAADPLVETAAMWEGLWSAQGPPPR